MVLNLAANELRDLSKSPDLFASLLFICKEGSWITQFLKFSPSVKIVIYRISIICKTATFKSEVHLLMSLPYRKKFLEKKKTPKYPLVVAVRLHFVASHGLSGKEQMDSSILMDHVWGGLKKTPTSTVWLLEVLCIKPEHFFGFTSLNSTDLKTLVLSKRYTKLYPVVKKVMYHDY